MVNRLPKRISTRWRDGWKMPMLTVKLPTARQECWCRTLPAYLPLLIWRQCAKRLNASAAILQRLTRSHRSTWSLTTRWPSIVLVMMRHLKKTYAWKWSATTNVMCSWNGESRCSVGLASCRQAQAFAIRLTSNISAKQYGANCRTVNGLLIRIHSLVLTRTPPWSTALACWGGALVASKQKPQC